jgi:phage gpG-like protein
MAKGFGIKLLGDWAKTGKIVDTMADRFRAAADKAIMREGHFLRGHMVQNITSGGAAAGAPFAPLSATTLKIRKFRGFGGTKVLMQTGALRGSITVAKVGGGVFVGILRKGGKGKGGRANVAEIHEFGITFSMPTTEKQRRFLMVALSGAKGTKGSPGKGSGARASGGGGGSIKVRIPARPFIGPVVDKMAQPEQVRKRFWDFMAKAMGYDLGK